MKMGLCIGTGPTSVKTRFVLELALAGKEQGIETEIFLFDDGIFNALNNTSVKCVTRNIKELAEANVPISICSNMAKHRGVNQDNVAEYIDISSLIAFSGLVNNSDIVITTR